MLKVTEIKRKGRKEVKGKNKDEIWEEEESIGRVRKKERRGIKVRRKEENEWG